MKVLLFWTAPTWQPHALFAIRRMTGGSSGTSGPVAPIVTLIYTAITSMRNITPVQNALRVIRPAHGGISCSTILSPVGSLRDRTKGKPAVHAISLRPLPAGQPSDLKTSTRIVPPAIQTFIEDNSHRTAGRIVPDAMVRKVGRRKDSTIMPHASSWMGNTRM